jgi:hypothetical protein
MSGELTAPCGLHCADRIPLREGLFETAHEFERLLEELDFAEYAALKAQRNSVFGDYGTFRRVLRAIGGLRGTLPCANGGCSAACPVRRCVRARGIAGCWECRDVELCEHMRRLRTVYPSIDCNHGLIRRYGVRGWSVRCKAQYAGE